MEIKSLATLKLYYPAVSEADYYMKIYRGYRSQEQ